MQRICKLAHPGMPLIQAEPVDHFQIIFFPDRERVSLQVFLKCLKIILHRSPIYLMTNAWELLYSPTTSDASAID